MGDPASLDTDELVDDIVAKTATSEQTDMEHQMEQVATGKATGTWQQIPDAARQEMGEPVKEKPRPAAKHSFESVPEAFDFEDQDFGHLKRKPPARKRIAGIWCMVEDTGDTKAFAEMSTDYARESIENFILAHITKPDLTERIRDFSTGALTMMQNEVMEHLGFSEDFFVEASASSTKKETQDQT